MKKVLVFAIFLLFVSTKVFSQFYYEVIANPNKTINFTIGVYVNADNVSYVEKENGTGYTTIDMTIINHKEANDFDWADYKIYILLKDGSTLTYNYTTAIKSGDYSCTYNIKSGETHFQKLCFAKKFSTSEIKNVWLGIDGQVYNLLYNSTLIK